MNVLVAIILILQSGRSNNFKVVHPINDAVFKVVILLRLKIATDVFSGKIVGKIKRPRFSQFAIGVNVARSSQEQLGGHALMISPIHICVI